MEETNATSPTASTREDKRKIPCIIVLGMAGVGKTAFVSKLVSTLSNTGKPYVINLDPACKRIPYPTDIDIRTTVNYKEVMEKYKLGPNSSIVTSFNIFSTKFEQIIQNINKVSDKHNYVIVDTPGQIEVFTWSAGGTIITEALASEFPTIIVYVVDTVKSTNPTTFMFNMLYSCSILYRTKLPFILVLNKTDIMKCDYAIEWMQDFTAFYNTLGNIEDNYAFTLASSMSLALEEFYRHLQYCGVSSITGDGFDKFLNLAEDAVKEYESNYKSTLESERTQEDQLKELTIEINKVNLDEMGELAPFSLMSDNSEESDN